MISLQTIDGTGDIGYKDVNCAGETSSMGEGEDDVSTSLTSLDSCSKSAWNPSGCSHGEDVGVFCDNDATTESRMDAKCCVRVWNQALSTPS